jgi:hypothetical protein
LRLRVCKLISELLVKCNVWCCMLNDAILVVSELVWNPSWFRLTTGIIWAQVRKFECFGACFCTCALIIWSVLLQSSSKIRMIKLWIFCAVYHYWFKPWTSYDSITIDLSLKLIVMTQYHYRFKPKTDTDKNR